MSVRLASPLGPSRPKTDELVRSMSAEFERAIYARTGGVTPPDPVLAALFHAFAVHIDRLYDEAEGAFPSAVLDDLLSGLGLTPREAQPAQTVVRFQEIDARAPIPPELAIAGVNPAGEPLVFSVDYPIELATSRLVFAGVVQRGECHVLGGAVAPGGGAFIPPRRFAVRAATGTSISLFMAIEVDPRHLSNLGLLLQVSALDADVLGRFSRAPWILLGADGVRREAGVMRSTDGPGGLRLLRWADADRADNPAPPGSAPSGAYGRSTFVFPEVPSEKRWSGAPPELLRATLASLIPARPDAYDGARLAWIEVPLAPGVRDVATLVERVILNCTTASNLEVVDQSLSFDRSGTTLRMRPEGADDRYLLGALSVIGEFGDWYVTEDILDAPLNSGRYRLREKVLEVRPHQSETGRRDRSATARLRLCDGSRANGLAIDALQQLRESVSGNPRLQVCNVLPTRGGSEPLAYPAARVRFADLVRTRERIITEDDIVISVHAFDARLTSVTVRSASRLRMGVLDFVDEVVASVPANALADPASEPVTIRDRLQKHLQGRWMMGRELVVHVKVIEESGR